MRAVVPLPTADQIRADIQHMVDLGPRLTGYPAHDELCQRIEAEMRLAGLHIAPPDIYDYDSFRTDEFSLAVLDGDSAGVVVAAR